MWDKLVLIHQRTIVQSLYHLQKNYYNMRLGENGDMATFIGNLEMLNNQIEELGTRPFFEDTVISKMLSNHPATYDTFQITWKTVAPDQQTLINLQTRLLDEEWSIHKHQTENAQSNTSAFYSRTSRIPNHPRRHRPNFEVRESMSGNVSRFFLPHEHHDTHFHRTQEIAAQKQVSCCGNCGEMGIIIMAKPWTLTLPNATSHRCTHIDKTLSN